MKTEIINYKFYATFYKSKINARLSSFICQKKDLNFYERLMIAMRIGLMVMEHFSRYARDSKWKMILKRCFFFKNKQKCLWVSWEIY